jgi:sec-independent protein translocase protein TatA
MAAMPDLGFGEILIVVVVLLVLFGNRRLPDMARSLGRSMRAFRAEARGLRDDDVRSRAEAPATRGPLGDPGPSDGTPTTASTPTGTAPTDTAPTGAASADGTPTGTAATPATPTGTAPTGTAPTGTAAAGMPGPASGAPRPAAAAPEGSGPAAGPTG